MSRRIAHTPEPAVEYTHRTSGERLLDVCSSLEGAVTYGDQMVAAGHLDVDLVEALRRPGGRYVKIS